MVVKRGMIVSFFVIAIGLCVFCFLIGYTDYLSPKLHQFSITSITKEDKLYLNYEKSRHAVKYYIKAIDEADNILFEASTSENKIAIDYNFINNQKVTFSVIAYNNKDESLDASNTYEYIYDDPTFKQSNSHYVMENRDYGFVLDGDLKETYKIKLTSDENTVYENSVTDSLITIPKSNLKNYSGRIVAKLMNGSGRVLSSMNIYTNSLVVSDLVLDTPVETNIDYGNIFVSYSGGENATNYKIYVYRGKKLIYTGNTKEKNYIIPSSYLSESTNYNIIVKGIYKDYEEIAASVSKNIYIKSMKQVSPVITDKYPSYIKKNTVVDLSSNTTDAKIYYTLDGSDPLIHGKLYDSPINITKDMVIKTVAKKDFMKDSIINTYSFKVNTKQIVVYLSPSNQGANEGVKSVGYSTEKIMMNKVADVVEAKLKAAGIKVLRNNPDNDMSIWLSESRNAKADFHFAIHSNGSANHDAQGMEIYVNDGSAFGLSIATKIYNNLYAIYPYKSDVTNHGVKYSLGSLGEANTMNCKNCALIEIAYHDQIDDAKWIVDNINAIGNNLAESIIDYFNV